MTRFFVHETPCHSHPGPVRVAHAPFDLIKHKKLFCFIKTPNLRHCLAVKPPPLR